uniref:Nif11-type n=1 Tax=Synechococcus sp. PCC 9341 TaxID=2099386 RepID=A0A2P0ZGC2_9SYNE|nr:Nif11-type precursor [Synechococcus sp. PCC 9341]
MSVKNVKAFYQRLAQDEQFRAELSEVKSKEECSKFVQASGYNFTEEEFENYTAELLESSENETKYQDTLEELEQQELATVFGGFARIDVTIYGLPFKLF